MSLGRRAVATLTATVLLVAAGLLVPIASATESAAKPHRQIAAHIVNPAPGVLRLKAKVPHYRGRPTGLLRKDCKSCTWHRVDHKSTNSRSRVSYRLGLPPHGRWFYRVRVPETRVFATSFSATFYVDTVSGRYSTEASSSQLAR